MLRGKPRIGGHARPRPSCALARGIALAAGLWVAAGTGGPARADEAGNVRDFIGMVTGARIFDLAPPWDETSPIASVNPPFTMSLNATHSGTRGTFGDGGQLSFTSEIQQ